MLSARDTINFIFDQIADPGPFDHFFQIDDPCARAIFAWMQELGKGRKDIKSLTIDRRLHERDHISLYFGDMVIGAYWNGSQLEEKAIMTAEVRLVVGSDLLHEGKGE